MAKFKVGDTVKRVICPCEFRHGERVLHVGYVGKVTSTHDSDWIDVDNLLGHRGFNGKYFELVTPPTPAASNDNALDLHVVLQMDRVIAKAGGDHSVLPEYLDRPLSDFVRNVMTPNKITLAHAA